MVKEQQKPTIYSWYIQLPLGVIALAVYFYSKYYDSRNEPVALVIGLPSLIAGLYHIYLLKFKRQARGIERKDKERR